MEIKVEIGSVFPRAADDYMEVKGRNLVNGLPDRVQVSANETIEAFSEVTAQIINAVLGVLETCRPALAAMSDPLAVTSAGGSLIYGMEQLIEAKTGIHAMVVDQALEAVALGAGKSVEFIHKLQK